MTSTTVAYFLYAAGILLREGFEALLVVVALTVAVAQLKNQRAIKSIYVGAALAVLASIFLAWSVGDLLSDNASDGLEGVFQLLGAATLLYVSSWLGIRGRAGNWKAFIKARVEHASHSQAPAAALALTAFTAVMREGAETIVFFQALLAGADQGGERRAVTSGIVLAVLGLIALAIVLQRAASWLPIGRFFSVTSTLLGALAVVFVGQGIASLQEAGILHATFIAQIPTIKILGVFPTVQTLTAQLALLLVVLGAIFIQRARALAAAPASPGSKIS
jgi:high-affinity iron transporter